jgi:hypothetical protein
MNVLKKIKWLKERSTHVQRIWTPLAYLFAELLGASRDARIHLDVGACLVCILKLFVKRRLPRVPVPSYLTSFLDTDD